MLDIWSAFDGTDSAIHAVIYIVLSKYIYGSKVGTHYRSTLFADLNLELDYQRGICQPLAHDNDFNI